MKKVTDEEFQQIQTLRSTLFDVMTTIGELHLSKIILNNQIKAATLQIEEQEKRFTEFQEQERVLFSKLQETYGSGNIDIETGEIKE